MPQKQTAQIYKANRRNSHRAFTLIELIIVIALTGILLSLIVGPLIQGFNLTNRARAYAEAQDASRFGIEQLRREISQATYVFDNSNTPIIMPFSDNVNDQRATRNPNVYSTQPGGNPQPSVLYGMIDFIPAATAGEGSGTIIDPTTGKPLGGSPLVLPLAPGRRYVRYFVGLREPFQKDATGKYTGPNYYGNPFEFKAGDPKDNRFNSFILWRAEYDPGDENLVVPGAPNTVNAGGLHDPNFFYNPNIAKNGRTFAENWRAVSSPVLASANLDLVAWRRNEARELMPGSPFQILINFTPTSVTGETATPGFLSNVSGDQGGAVPNIYGTQFGHWTFPYTITVYRGSAQGGQTGADFGAAQFTVQQTANPNLVTSLQVTMNSATGDTIAPDNGKYYWLYDDTTGKIFIHTAKLTFQIDPARGRIETAFPPLATQNGVILYRDANGKIGQLAAGPNGNYGRLVTTVFRQNTRRQNAGQNLGGNSPIFVPTNAGLLSTTLDLPFYYEVTAPLPAFQTPGVAYPSPFKSLMGGNYQSIILAPDSEKVMGPDVNMSTDGTNLVLTTYSRLPLPETGLSKPKGDGSGAPFIRTVPPNYTLETSLGQGNAPLLAFDDRSDPVYSPGLPAAATANVKPQGELQVTYLWQDNFCRDANGNPVNTWGEITTSSDAIGKAMGHLIKIASDYRPEPDVFKVDYATRAQMSILLGARVFDTSSGDPQTAQINTTVNVGNITR